MTSLDWEGDDDLLKRDEMPTSRLKDIYDTLTTKKPTVVNLDALLPPGKKGLRVLKTILYNLPVSVQTLSLRFNQLNNESVEALLQWLALNNTLHALYLMGSGIDSSKERFEAAWKRNLSSHRTDNMGSTFIRIFVDPNAQPVPPEG